MPEPAFLVEGCMEQRIIQELCPRKPVRLIGCNGDDVSVAAIAKALNARIRLLGDYHPIIIILDRERRVESCGQLIQDLSALLDNTYNHQGKYVIGMADRTIENWILSDWDSIASQNSSFKALTDEIQGAHGKSEIRKLLPKEIIYHETTVGVDLFLKCRPAQLFASNESFRNFVSQLNIECWWLSEIDSRFAPTSWSCPQATLEES
jgi:hypothetical protein